MFKLNKPTSLPLFITLSCLIGLIGASIFNDDESEQMLDRMECYRCLHDPSDGNRPVCDVEYKPGTLLLLTSPHEDEQAGEMNDDSMWNDEEDDEDDERDQSRFIQQRADVIRNQNPSLFDDDLKLNPCFVVAGKVLEMVEDLEEEQIAFYNNMDTITGEKSLDLPILKSEITAVQFQSGKNAIFAEVQLNGGIDVFTFLITDPVIRVMVPENSWYYGRF